MSSEPKADKPDRNEHSAGSCNDRDPIRVNVGSSALNSVRTQQLRWQPADHPAMRDLSTLPTMRRAWLVVVFLSVILAELE